MIRFTPKSNTKTQKINLIIQKDLNAVFALLKNKNVRGLKQLPLKSLIKNIEILSKKNKLNPELTKRLWNILETVQNQESTSTPANFKIFKDKLKTILMQTSNRNINKISETTNKNLLPKTIKNLDAVLKEFASNKKEKSNTSSIKLLSNSHIIKNIGNITKNLQSILNLIKDQPSLLKYKPVLENFTKPIYKTNLKENIQNSGILFETKLKENFNNTKFIKKILTNDLKAVLSNIKKDNKNSTNNPLIDKLSDKSILQIQSSQINSIINSNFTSFIPFNWKNLKDGKISFKHYKKTKNFTCKIELDLEQYGNINIFLALNESNLSIGINTCNEIFGGKIRNNLRKLKTNLNNIGLNTNIFFLKDKKENEYELEDVIKLGMDIRI